VPGLHTYTDTVRFLESSSYTDGTDSPAEGIRSAEAEEGAAAEAAAAAAERASVASAMLKVVLAAVVYASEQQVRDVVCSQLRSPISDVC
jgi:hypothetical protein